jgi:hypothetical protein
VTPPILGVTSKIASFQLEGGDVVLNSVDHLIAKV